MFNEVDRLLVSKSKKIISSELHNEDRMNLYCVGEYWAAFEKSAFVLTKLVPESVQPMVINVKGYPFPLVMNLVSYPVIDRMCRRRAIAKRNLEYIQFMTDRIDDRSYNRWYDEVTAPDED